MCGIAGYLGNQPLSETSIHQTLELMKRRGPDHQGFISVRSGDKFVSLLHSRLSIIDLEPRSNQPFTIGDCTLIFNGEIYNYLEIRKQLESEGVLFHTESDTEVLLQTYLKYGEDCVHHFEGMWSFAVYNRRTRTLFLSRDRFAEKPLYFLQTPEGFYFGSEIKLLKSLSGLKLTVDRHQLLRFMVNGYRTIYKDDETFFEEVQEAPFAANMVVRPDLSISVRRYWQPRYCPRAMSLEEAIDGARHHIFESIRLRMRADVPLACCLSGGVDSSSIVSVLTRNFGCDVATFSIIDLDERYNEYENIRTTIDDLGCKNTMIFLEKDQALSRLQELVRYHDAPLITISYYIHSLLSKAISENGYRVVLSGTGADEIFTGYYDHFNLHLYEMRERPDFGKYLSDWQEHVYAFVRNPFLRNPEYYFSDPQRREHIVLNSDQFADFLQVGFREDFTETSYCECLLRNRMMNEMFHEATRVILHEDDLNSMMYSVENRSPYLDRRLFDFAFTIPNEHLIREGYGKYILREAVKDILNDKVWLDRHKKGFNASIHSVLNFQRKQDREYLLDNSNIYEFVDK